MGKLGGRPASRTPDLGEKFGLWEVIGGPVRETNPKSIRIPCRCACGYEKANLKSNLLRGITRGCAKCYGRRKRSTDAVPGWFWSHIIVNARKRNINVSMTREEAEILFLQQDRRCALSGHPIGFAEMSTGRRSLSTASFDRRDSRIGYVTGNVQWVHKIVNLMKNTLGEEEFLTWCGTIARYRPTTLPLPSESRLLTRFKKTR